MLNSMLFVIACLLLPNVWGVGVNWAFNFWQKRDATPERDDSIFPDYQI